jgi:hypothetical protein
MTPGGALLGPDGLTVATCALAIATFALVLLNRRLVVAARDQLRAAEEGLKLAQAQTAALSDRAATARAALEQQAAPRLASAQRHVGPSSAGEAGAARIVVELAGGIGLLSVPVRNVGSAVAVVHATGFAIPGLRLVFGHATSPVVAPGEETRLMLQVRPAAEEWSAFQRGIVTRGEFLVMAEYSDPAGESWGAVRLDIRRGDAADGGWYVRQTHFGESMEQAWGSPKLSSWPIPVSALA